MELIVRYPLGRVILWAIDVLHFPARGYWKTTIEGKIIKFREYPKLWYQA
jgi:hypothetical protein